MSTLNISLDTPLNLQTRWPTVSRGGAYCGGHIAAQLVSFFYVATDFYTVNKALCVCILDSLVIICM